MILGMEMVELECKVHVHACMQASACMRARARVCVCVCVCACVRARARVRAAIDLNEALCTSLPCCRTFNGHLHVASWGLPWFLASVMTLDCNSVIVSTSYAVHQNDFASPYG
eukprot:jgi/Botrbrau1/16648/Bobra.0068s0065.2